MYTLLDDQIFRSIWKYSAEVEVIKPHEFFFSDLKSAKKEAKEYFKGKMIVRFAFVLPLENYDECLFEKEFYKLCKKFNLDDKSFHCVDTFSNCISYTRYPKIESDI